MKNFLKAAQFFGLALVFVLSAAYLSSLIDKNQPVTSESSNVEVMEIDSACWTKMSDCGTCIWNPENGTQTCYNCTWN